MHILKPFKTLASHQKKVQKYYNSTDFKAVKYQCCEYTTSEQLSKSCLQIAIPDHATHRIQSTNCWEILIFTADAILSQDYTTGHPWQPHF